MTKIKDIENFNLFQEISSGNFLDIFDVVSAENMDFYYLAMYGERYTSNLFNKYEISKVAEIISQLYNDKWNNIYNYIKNSVPILNTYGNKTSEVTTNTGAENTERTLENKISAYNASDYSENTKDVENSNLTFTDRKTTKETTYTDIKNIDLNNIVDYLKTNYIYDTIFTDVNNIITLSIFDSSLEDDTI